MRVSVNTRIQTLLQIADGLLCAGLVVVAYTYPPNLMSTQGYVTAISWYISLLLVGGHQPGFLRPRYRIFISMGLALVLTAAVSIVWAGSGWNWYMKGGLFSLALLALAGTTIRFLAASFIQPSTLQIVPFAIPPACRLLLDELASQPHVLVEPEVADQTTPLPRRKPGYGTYLVAADLRLRESSLPSLLSLVETVEVVDLCDLYEQVTGKAAIIEYAGEMVMVKALRTPSPVRMMLKRLFDISFSLLITPIALPIIAFAAVLVKLTSTGPVYFRQRRLGRYGRPFELIKLRTMVTDAELRGQCWSGAGDPRVTPIGRLLRASGIDELPQLWNVLRGDLSLVGPRPECPSIASKLTSSIPLYRARLFVDPGVTGWAQLHQGSDVDLADVNSKLAYDLYYLQHHSLLLDIRILGRTIQMLLHMAKPAPKPAVLPAALTTSDV